MKNEIIVISKKFTDCHEAVSWAIKQHQLRKNGAEIYLNKTQHPAGHMVYHVCRSVVPSDHVDIVAIGSTFEKVIYGTKYEYAVKHKILINDVDAVIIPVGDSHISKQER